MFCCDTEKWKTINCSQQVKAIAEIGFKKIQNQ
jgi:hypothetical protein